MRRLLAWAHSARFRFGLVFLALVATLPGLLALQPQPVAADSANSVTALGSVPDTPKQMSGTAAGLPSLLSAEATRATADPGTPKAKVVVPKRALPREVREGVVRTKQAGPLAASLIRGAAPVAVAAAGPPCGSYSPWQRSVYVAYGTYVASGQRIWKAIQNIPANLNIYPPEEEGTGWLLIGDCPKAPPPAVTSMSPDNGIQLMTTEPTLTVQATTWPGGSIGYDFEVCDSPSMTGCVTEDPFNNSWTVPKDTLGWGRQYWWRVLVSDASTIGGSSGYSPTYTFVIGVRQPTITSQLSVRGVNGQEFNQQSGNYTTTFTDAQVATAGPPLSVVRAYNSMDPRRDGAFGAGWSTRWDMRIVAESVRGRDAALVTYPDGRQVRFAKKDDGTFQPPPGMYATLAKNADGSWRLMDKASTSYLFDGGGRLLKVADSRGRSQELTYGTDGKLAKVTAPGGRSLTFSWTGAHVTTVSTDAVDGKVLSWAYSYNGDMLEKVCDPSTACTLYQLNTGSLYRSTVLDSDPMGYWRLGESTGSTSKNLGWVGDDAHYNVGYTLAKPGALAGTTDTGVQIAASSNPNINLSSDAISRIGAWGSVETWFKTTATGTLMTTGYGPLSEPHPLLEVTAAGKLSAAYQENSTPIVTSASVKDGLWHHAVFTVGGTVQTLYVDGQPAGTVTERLAGFSDNEGLDIGGGIAATVDDTAVYDRPLSAVEVARHYAARVAAPHELTKITLPSGRVWAANTYDSSTERIKTHTDQHGGTWQLAEPTLDRTAGTSTIVVTDPKNEKLTAVHDVWRGNRLISTTDQLGKKTRYDYDTGGFLSEMTDANNNTTTWYNDKRGNTISTGTCHTDSSCQTAYTEFYFNKNDQFDARNDRVSKVRDARSSGSADNTYATSYEYNQYGEPVKKTTPKTPDFPNGRSAVIAYTDGSEAAVGGGVTPAGLVASQTDARGNAWTYRYTVTGDLAEQHNPAGLLVKLGYDTLGRLRDKTEVSQAYPDGVKTTFTYDELGRPATKTEPGVKNEVSGVTHTKRTAYAYDLDGNKLSETITDLTGGDAERATVYTYDAQGRVETVTDPEGGAVRQSWNTLGQLATVTDARGAVVDYGYSKRGQFTSRTLKGWTGSPVNPQPAKDVVLESFSYDDGGRLATQEDAMGRKTSYTYFADNLLAKKFADDVKVNDSKTVRDVDLEVYAYDAAGNKTELVTGGENNVTTGYVYDAAGRLTSQTFDPDGLNRTTAFVYDANDNPLKATRTGAGSTRTEVTEYTYNKVNQVTKSIVENGSVDLVASIDFDDRGLVTASTDPRGNAEGATKDEFTTTMRYDALGRLVEASGPQVKVDKAGAASDAHPTVHYGYDMLGATTHETDAEGRTVTSIFDKAGRLKSQIAPTYTPPSGTPVTPTTLHIYDPAGQLISTTDPRGFTTTFDYDKLGRQVRITDPAPQGETPGRSVIEYDLADEELAAVDATGARIEATYDGLGRQITRTQVERKPTPAAYTTTLTYDDAGYLTKSIAPGPGNKTTEYKVNADGSVKTQTDPMLNKTTLDYDLDGRPVKVTDARLNVTTAEYDLAGRKIATKDLDSTGAVLRTSSVGYDLAGNQISTTSGENHTTKQTFDALNRVTSLIEPVSGTEAITTSFGYDATGARTRLTDGRGNATWTAYNNLGLAETVTEPSTTAHPNVADRTWTASYDQAGNAVAVLQPGGVRIDRTFDHLGRLTAESGAGGGAASAERSFGYDLAGRPTAIGDLTVDYNDRTLPLSVKRGTTQQTGYVYDALGNPLQRVDAAGTATFTWDNNNRLGSATDPVTGRKLTYGYDQVNNLTSLTATTGTTTTDTQIFTYDNLDRPQTHTLRKGTSTGTQLAKITYGWDKDDNLTTKTTTGTAGAGTNTYGYDHAGRLTSWTAPGGATTTYAWDASGNRTKVGDKTYTYDERNRLTSGDGADYTYTPRGTLATQTKAGVTTQLTFDAFDRLIADGDSLYSYDALDRVTTRIKGAAKQTFAYSGFGTDLAAINDSGGAVQAKYGRDAFGALIGQQEGTNPALATMTDLHGDLVATFSATALATTTAYDPFGAITAQTGAKTNLGYQGEYTDPDTGKVNMHARWYQPGTGSFASRDTWTLPPWPSVQANRYTYGNANPLANSDPTGHGPCHPDSWYYQQTSSHSGGDPCNTGNNSGNKDGRDGRSPDGTPITVSSTERVVDRHPTPTPHVRKPTVKHPGTGQPTVKEPPRQSQGEPGGPKIPPKGSKKDRNSRDPKKKKKPAKPEVQVVYGDQIAENYGVDYPDEPDGGTPTISTVGFPTDDSPPDGTPPFQPTDDFWRGVVDSSAGIFESAWNMTCVVCHLVPGFTDLPQLPAQTLFGTDPTSPEYKTGYWGANVLSMLIAPEAEAVRPGTVPKVGGGVVRNPCLNSFAAGTQVLMADGTRKNIEDVKVGDEVWATNPETGQAGARKVTAVHRNVDTEMADVAVQSDDGMPSTLHTTMEHPFWDGAHKMWVDAGDLHPEDTLQTADGRPAEVVKVRTFDSVRLMYNLSVDDLHTYYVLAGTAPILVHNTPYPCDLPASEANGGHAIERHVGKDDAYLRGRNLPNASTYRDLAAATRETQANLDAHASDIRSWLSGSSPQTTIRNPILDPADARVLNRATGGEVPGRTVVTTLRRDANMPDGFRIHTSYVDP
ncbi:polymorphic toxin-type HINT domain-containing protein [Nonomuraea sp. CA-143628]|uniref:polymorphic toxin-type HINT domain-containing protein n=1 Tax=Nonomuraea sp. CA-143628 TaxID=3239997 RepID=UPI003D8BB970